MVRVGEVTTKGVGWASEEASDLVALPLNLVLYMYLRIFAYTSNTKIASFECMELILVSGTLKNVRFLLRSCLSTDRAPVIELICSTFQPWRCITVLMTLRRDAYWFSGVLLTLMRYRSQTSDILLCSRIQKIPAVLPTGGRTAIPSGRIRHNLSFAIVSFGMPSLILLSSTCVRGRAISRARAAFHIVSWVRFKY
jgi:hypothetical protein